MFLALSLMLGTFLVLMDGTFNMVFVASSKFGSESEVLGGGDDVLAGARHSEAQQTLKLAVSRRSADYVYHASFRLRILGLKNSGLHFVRSASSMQTSASELAR